MALSVSSFVPNIESENKSEGCTGPKYLTINGILADDVEQYILALDKRFLSASNVSLTIY